MFLNLRSLSSGALDGGVEGGEALMATYGIRWPRLVEWGVVKEMQDCDVENLGVGWMKD